MMPTRWKVSIPALTGAFLLWACASSPSGAGEGDSDPGAGTGHPAANATGDDATAPGSSEAGSPGDDAGVSGGGDQNAGLTLGTGGYVTSGSWHGYAWTAADGTGSTITPKDFSAATSGKPLCVSGSVAGLPDFSGVAMLGVNLNQSDAPGAATGTVTPTLDGVTVNVSNSGQSPLRLQIEGPTGGTDANDRWCAPLTGTGGFVPWSSFNTECWSGGAGTAYDGKSPLTSVSILVPGTGSGATAFAFCLNSVAATTAAGGTNHATDAGSTETTSPAPDASPGVLGGSGTLTSQYASAPVTRDGRNYIVQNNVWGGSGNQTVTYDGTTFDVTQQTGSNPTNGAPVSYPSVFIGSNNGRSTSGSNLPKLVSSLTGVPTTWSNNAGTPSGTYDAAYDVWFSTSASGDPGSPSGGFLMVWYYKPKDAQPIGSVKFPGVTIPGASGTWDVWIGDNGAVPCISYVRTQSIQSMGYDLNAFIHDAVTNRPGTIQTGWYLTNVYAGFEIWTGGQGLSTTSFSVVVN
jgi:hypothetical protein